MSRNVLGWVRMVPGKEGAKTPKVEPQGRRRDEFGVHNSQEGTSGLSDSHGREHLSDPGVM